MAISITWGTRVINVGKSSPMTLVQSSPIEIWELDLNIFRNKLNDLQDGEEGMSHPTTHIHNPPLSVGGVTLARTVEIINDYTITFEDGQYAVNLVGANSNVGDRVNVNQVSVRSANSAGLVTSAAIEYGEYGGGVHIDQNDITGKATSGSIYPIGTLRSPCDNVSDAMIIANARGFSKLYILGDITFTTGDDVSSMIIIGENSVKSIITIESGADVTNCEISFAHIEGVLDGGNLIHDGALGDLTYFSGEINNCGLKGEITLAGATPSVITDCKTIDPNNPPSINMGGSGQDLSMPFYSGLLSCRNMSSGFIGIGLNGGQIILENTITGGTVHVSGVGKLLNSSGDEIPSGTWNGTTIVNDTLSRRTLTRSVAEGTVQSATVNTITLDSNASSNDGAYDPAEIYITGGTGEGQTRNIYEYDGSTKTAVIDRNWKTNPDTTSTYMVIASSGREHVNEGLAQGGTSNTITLNANASSSNNAYKWQTIFIRSGTGDDQVRSIQSYDGTTKVATVTENWEITPDSTSAYVMLPQHNHHPAETADAVWDELATDHNDSDTMGGLLNSASVGGVNYGALADAVWDEDSASHTDSGSMGAKVNDIKTDTDRLRDIAEGNWSIVGTQMIFYDTDSNEIMRFNLKDSSGSPSNDEVFSREKV